MSDAEFGPGPTRDLLLDYFSRGARPRGHWQVGMEVEKLGRHRVTGLPLPFETQSSREPSIRGVLERYLDRRGGAPVLEGDHLIGIDAPWGGLSLEPGGQVEWSSAPRVSMDELHRDLDEHQLALRDVGDALGVRWLDVAVDPDHPLDTACWMPKARYAIMREYLGRRGRLAHRMMTQTASIQCSFDYADPTDWARKFKAAALLTPVAAALFANSSRLEGSETGWRSFRQAIWRETDPDRCGLPAVVFEAGFDMARWLDWVLSVPTIFRHRARGLVPTGGVPFRELMGLAGCQSLKIDDWETHASTIFTDVRSYTYIEIRCADLLPDALAFGVPAFWAGLLYHDGALDGALALGHPCDDATRWNEAMLSAGRLGLEGTAAGRSLRELAAEAVRLAVHGLEHGAECVVDPALSATPLRALAERVGIEVGA